MTNPFRSLLRDDEDRWLTGALLLFAFTLPITISVSEALAFLLLPLWWWRRRGAGAPEDGAGLAGLLAAVFVALAVLSSLMGTQPAHSMGKLVRLLPLAVTFILPAVSRSARQLPLRLCAAFLAGATCKAAYDVVRIPVGAWFAYQRLLVEPAFSPDLPHAVSVADQALFSQGTMRDPQFYLVALCLLVAGWAVGVRSWRQRGSWIPLVLLGGALVLHFKRGAVVATALSLLVMALLARQRRLLAVLVVMLLSLCALPQVRERLAMTRNEFSVTMAGRYPLWTQAAPSLLRDFPFGVGWQALRYEDLCRRTRFVQEGLNHLHNNLLQVAVELGWLGAAVWLTAMLAALVQMARGWSAARGTTGPVAGLALGVLCAFLGLMLVGLVENNFGDTEIFMLLCLLWGLAAAVARPDARRPA